MGFREQIPKGMAFYEFIKQELKHQIGTGVLKQGDRVPSELKLARELRVSRSQTRLALRDLEMSGYLLRSPDRGSFGAPPGNRAKQLGMRGFRMVAMAAADFYSIYRRRVIESFSDRILETGFRTLTYFLRLHDERELEFLQESRNTGIEGQALWIQDRSECVSGRRGNRPPDGRPACGAHSRTEEGY
jgi:DNA-binding transcriptional regulator YhcF (GntR family)